MSITYLWLSEIRNYNHPGPQIPEIEKPRKQQVSPRIGQKLDIFPIHAMSASDGSLASFNHRVATPCLGFIRYQLQSCRMQWGSLRDVGYLSELDEFGGEVTILTHSSPKTLIKYFESKSVMLCD